MLEIELSVLARQCLARRIADTDSLQQEVKIWEQQPNARQATVDWRFTCIDATTNLKRLYPIIHPS
jgi:hypothetical protein